MRKNLLLTVLTVSLVVFTYGIGYTQELVNDDETKPIPIEEKKILLPPEFDNDIKKGPNEINSNEFKRYKSHSKHIKGPKPSKAEMKAKKAEFEKRLNLTEKQKKQIEENRKKDHEKVKPIFDQMRDKKHELRRIKRDTTLSPKNKEKKIEKLKSDIKLLNEKADKYRQENMRKFESILTEEQKQEFAKIKEEQKQEMERRRVEFENMRNSEMKPLPQKQPIDFPEKE